MQKVEITNTTANKIFYWWPPGLVPGRDAGCHQRMIAPGGNVLSGGGGLTAEEEREYLLTGSHNASLRPGAPAAQPEHQKLPVRFVAPVGAIGIADQDAAPAKEPAIDRLAKAAFEIAIEETRPVVIPEPVAPAALKEAPLPQAALRKPAPKKAEPSKRPQRRKAKK